MLFSNVIALDLGTNNTKIYKKSKEVILEEKTTVTIDDKGNVVAFGDSSYEMYEKTPPNKKVVFPIKNGVIADIQSTNKLANLFLKKIKLTKGLYKKNIVYIAVPINITEVEQRAFKDLFYNTKYSVKDVVTISKPLAAAVGVGIDIMSPQGHLIVDIGAETTEIAVISLGGIVTGRRLAIGGNRLTESIATYIKKQYNLFIGFKTAEYMKLNICSVFPDEVQNVNITGRDIVSGLPKTINITSDQLITPMEEYLHEIIDAVRYILERTPPELSADIIETGVYITGGGSNLEKFDVLMNQETGLQVHQSDDPSNSVIKGLGIMITSKE